MHQPQITIIPILPFGMLNAYLVAEGEACILVDTGLPGSVPKIEAAMRGAGLHWRNIKAIVLTHAHVDHAGSAHALRAHTDAPIIAHQREIPYLSGTPPLVRATKGFGRFFQLTRLIERPYEYFQPDVALSDDMVDLSAYGLTAHVVATPGHTPGSISVVLNDGRVLAGDLVASGILLGGIALKDRPKQPPYEEDTIAVAKSLQHLLSLGGRSFYLGHGGPLSAPRVEQHLAALRKAAKH